MPAKIYEYLRFDAWLLILARANSATAALLRGTDADVVAPDDVDRIAAVIRQRYEQFARGERPRAVGADGRFDRKAQATLLLDRIARVARQRTNDLALGQALDAVRRAVGRPPGLMNGGPRVSAQYLVASAIGQTLNQGCIASNRSAFIAIASWSSQSTIRPLSSCVTMYGMPPARVVTTGSPAANDSMIELGMLSMFGAFR